MKTFLRFRFEDNRLMDIDPSIIVGAKIEEDIPNHEYYLSLMSTRAEFLVFAGSAIECHKELDRIMHIIDGHALEMS